MTKASVASIVVVAIAMGGWAIFWRARNVTQLTLEPLPDGVAHVWPMNHSWTWSFPLPKNLTSRSLVGLDIREKSTPIPPNIIPGIGTMTVAMSPGDAERRFSPANFSRLTNAAIRSGSVTIQFIDLTEIGVQSATQPSSNLRLLVAMSIGGTETRLSGDQIFLPQGKFAGYSLGGATDWNRDELYVMSFYVISEGRFYRYDVVLQHKPN